ncbi:MAG: NTP transferase domain-containing protein [Halolamina sp.]
MRAIVLCGGRGSRLGGRIEKPLREVGDVPMIERVLSGLSESAAVDSVFAAVTPQAPATAEWARDAESLRVVETPGEGYVDDLNSALDAVGTPAVTVAADLPLLAGEHVDRAVAATRQEEGPGGRASVTVLTPARLKRRLDVSVDEGDTDWLPTGLNVVGDTDSIVDVRTWDARLAVNVNYERDLAAAEALLVEG